MADRQLVVKAITERLATVITEADISDLTEDRVLSEFPSFDSLGILETLVWLEEAFDVSIPDEELVADRFDSIAKMADYVVSHQV
ncbi:acyl carrier protein [Streptomyces sp. NPDC056987]|uniref:acyl carrier protein n=1 Tax=Streptomyces sp. NPDC056987 TaxID=3345988 RepID=UPI0036341969